MADDFKYDVFLSHSSKDKPIVRAVAERLRADGVRVWLDEWEIKPGDSIPAKIEDGLAHSRVLLRVAALHKDNEEIRKLLVEASRAIGSDYEQARALACADGNAPRGRGYVARKKALQHSSLRWYSPRRFSGKAVLTHTFDLRHQEQVSLLHLGLTFTFSAKPKTF